MIARQGGLVRMTAGLKAVRSSALSGQAAWIVAPFAAQQVLRLATNIVLARMLVPEIFGLMLLVNTLRTGVELLSDIGIGQSVVRSPNGDNRRFLNVAWTLQAMRGLLLTLFALAVAVPLGEIYRDPQVTSIIAVVSSVFLLTGLQSPGLFLMQRDIRLRRRAVYELANTIFQCAFTIALAAVMPSVWALVWGLVISTAFGVAISYLVSHSPMPGISFERGFVREIFHFGKWIFFATAIYFAAISVDKFYFTAVLSLSLAGIYSIARTFADMLGQLAHRAGMFLVFPKMAALRDQRQEAAVHLRRKRFRILAALGLSAALAIACSDRLILLCYDQRYHVAAFLLPLLLVATWFGVLATFAEATLMGCDKPAPAAFANAIKFLVMLLGLPLALQFGGLGTALGVLIAAEMSRWALLAFVLQKEHLATVSDDLVLTLGLALAAFLSKTLLALVGLVPSLSEWWALGASLHG